MKNVFLKIFLIVLFFSLLQPNSLMVFGQVTSSSSVPAMVDSGWRLVIDGAVAYPLNLFIPDIFAMPKTTVKAALYCEGLLIDEGEWGGVLLSVLLEQAEISPDATSLEFHAADQYRINVSRDGSDELIVAYELNGQLLPETLRLILPEHPGFYWISMIEQISVTMSTDFNVELPPSTIPITTPTSMPSTSPSPTNSPTLIPTQAPTPTPEPTITPTPFSTQQPTLTPQPSQTQPPDLTPSPTMSPSQSISPTPIPSSQPTFSLFPTQNQSTASPADSPLESQQTETAPITEAGSPMNYEYLALFGTLVVGILGSVIAVRKKNAVPYQNQQKR